MLVEIIFKQLTKNDQGPESKMSEHILKMGFSNLGNSGSVP